MDKLTDDVPHLKYDDSAEKYGLQLPVFVRLAPCRLECGVRDVVGSAVPGDVGNAAELI